MDHLVFPLWTRTCPKAGFYLHHRLAHTRYTYTTNPPPLTDVLEAYIENSLSDSESSSRGLASKFYAY
jgi:hypothetical protein